MWRKDSRNTQKEERDTWKVQSKRDLHISQNKVSDLKQSYNKR